MGNAYLGVQYDIATKFRVGMQYENGDLSGIAEGEKVKDEFSFINPKAELELKAGVGLFFGVDIVIEKLGGPTFNIGPQVNLTGKLSYQMGDDRINASIEGKAGIGGEVGAKLKIFGFELADWRTYFDIGPQWTIFKYPDDGSGSSGDYDPNSGGGGKGRYPNEGELTEKYKDYNYIPLNGTEGETEKLGYENIFDGSYQTRWEARSELDNTWHLEFKSKAPITPSKYYLYNGYSSGDNYRNPGNWKLMAKSKSSDEWTTIATVNNDSRLPDNSQNHRRLEYDLDVKGRAWQYFRFEFKRTRTRSHVNLAEFEFDVK
jgi:hypothetical protein